LLRALSPPTADGSPRHAAAAASGAPAAPASAPFSSPLSSPLDDVAMASSRADEEEEDEDEDEEEDEDEDEDEALLGGDGDGDVHGGAYLRVTPLEHPAVRVQPPPSLRPARSNPCGAACSPMVQPAARWCSL